MLVLWHLPDTFQTFVVSKMVECVALSMLRLSLKALIGMILLQKTWKSLGPETHFGTAVEYVQKGIQHGTERVP